VPQVFLPGAATHGR
jgi:hypothetical protein